MTRALDNGATVWVAPLAGLLAFDAALVTHGHRSMSEHAGQHPALTGGALAYLALHLLGGHFLPDPIKRLDPLGAASRLLSR